MALAGLTLSAMVVSSVGQGSLPGDEDIAEDVLREPARQILDSVPVEGDKETAAAAFSAHAYLSAIALASEAKVMPEQQEAWEAAQDDPKPPQAFLQYVLDEWHATRNELETALGLLEHKSVNLHEEDAGRLIIAAHILVQAEINHDLAGRFLSGSAESKYVQTADQRYAFLRPLTLTREGAAAAVHLLKDPMIEEGSLLDLDRIDSQVDQAGGSHDDEFDLDEAGALHRLARHVMAYETSVDQGDLSNLTKAASRLDEIRGSWSPDVPRHRAAVVSLDVAWWLDRAETTSYDPDFAAPLLATLEGYVIGVEYEMSLLEDAFENLTQDNPSQISIPGPSTLVVVGLAITMVDLARRSMAKSRTENRP